MWRYGRGRLRPVFGCGDTPDPLVSVGPTGVVESCEEARWVVPVPALDGYWYEIVDPTETPSETSERLAPVLSQLLSGEVDTLRLAEELADRYEEIELLYTISEVLGQTLSLDAAAQRIVREVSAVVGSRRGSILVYDENTDLLRPVAGAGIDVSAFNPIRRDDPASVAARVFRERRPIFDDSAERLTQPASTGARRSYRGAAFLSVPILYPGPDGAPRPIGVINLTDRIGTDAFSAAERRLVAAIANQIGAAIENARLVASDRSIACGASSSWLTICSFASFRRRRPWVLTLPSPRDSKPRRALVGISTTSCACTRIRSASCSVTCRRMGSPRR